MNPKLGTLTIPYYVLQFRYTRGIFKLEYFGSVQLSRMGLMMISD